MYDAVTARNIPRNPPPALVAGYIDKIKLEPWSAADWAMFPASRQVQIVKKASTNAGHVLDVEPGDATPAQAPGWADMRRRSGFPFPVIYCNLSTWPSVQAEFVRQRVPQPLYWIAHYNGVIELPVLNGIRAVAKQHSGDVPPGIDISCVADFWPGVDPTPVTNPEDDLMFSHKLAEGAGRHTDTVTIEADGVSTIIDDVYVSLASGFDGLANVTVFFPGGGDPQAGSHGREIASLPRDTRAWWKVPVGCFAFSIEWDNVSDFSRPSLSFVYTKK